MGLTAVTLAEAIMAAATLQQAVSPQAVSPRAVSPRAGNLRVDALPGGNLLVVVRAAAVARTNDPEVQGRKKPRVHCR